MTTNKPEIRAFLMQQDGYDPYVSIGRDSNCSGVTHPLIRLSDYESLQAECEKLRKDAARYRWMCDGNGYFLEHEMLCGFENEKAEADAAIDAAMQETNL